MQSAPLSLRGGNLAHRRDDPVALSIQDIDQRSMRREKLWSFF